MSNPDLCLSSVEPERWVNAVVSVVIPLDDVAVDNSKWSKRAAARRAADRLVEALPKDMQEFVLSATWEDIDGGHDA